MKKYLFFAGAIVLLISAFVALHSFYPVEAQTTGDGTFTIHAQICQTLSNFQSPSGVTCSVTPRDPSATEAPQFSYDIQRYVGQGPSTQITTPLSNISTGKSYSLPANTPNAGNNNRDEYAVVFKGAPTNYNYVGAGGFINPYTFTVSIGQNTDVNIPYTIYQAVEQTAPVGTTISADIVDGNGKFVRALTASETQSVSFDIQHSVPTGGGNVGSLAGNFSTQVSSGKLNTSYSLSTYVHSGSILTNIKSPSGYVIRSIDAGIQSGTYFDPAVGNVTIHFTQSPVASQVQSADQMLYVPNGISYVKKIAQTYSDSEYKYSNLDADEYYLHNNGNRPFPINWTVAKYSGVPYLFMNGTGKIVVYNISDPANPKQVSEFTLSTLESFNQSTRTTGAGDITSGQCQPGEGLALTHDDMLSARRIFAIDDTPYVLIDIQERGPSGVAVLSLNPSTMTMTAYPQWTQCGYSLNGAIGTAYGMYKGSDGNTYFVSEPFGDGAAGSNGQPTISILSVNSAGVFGQVATLSKYLTKGAADDIDYRSASIFSLGNKTYLIGNASALTTDVPIYIYDISDPKNITKVGQPITMSAFGGLKIDEQGKRMYVQSSIPNPAATSTPFSSIPKTLSIWQVYDLSVLPNAPKLITSYNNAANLLNPSQVSADFSEIAKRLNIVSSSNLMDTSSFSLGFGISSSHVQLINVSNNLAYVSLESSGKTPWDTIANQAGITDGSEYGTSAIQFVVDLTSATQPKILGMIFGHTEYAPGTISVGGWFDIPISGSIFDYNGYIYRANYRIADVWKLGNPPAQTTGVTGGGSSGSSSSSISPATIQNLQQSLFSFQNLLNIFKKALGK